MQLYLDNQGRPYTPPAWSDDQGVSPAELTTPELYALLSTTHLTREQLGAIRRELESREI